MKNIKGIVFTNAWKKYRNSSEHTKKELSKLLTREWEIQKELLVFMYHKDLVIKKAVEMFLLKRKFASLYHRHIKIMQTLDVYFDIIGCNDYSKEYLIKYDNYYKLRLKNSNKYIKIEKNLNPNKLSKILPAKSISSVISYIKITEMLFSKLEKIDLKINQMKLIKMIYIKQILDRLSYPIALKTKNKNDYFKVLRVTKKLIYLDQNLVYNKAGLFYKQIPYEFLYGIAVKNNPKVILPLKAQKQIERKIKIEELGLV